MILLVDIQPSRVARYNVSHLKVAALALFAAAVIAKFSYVVVKTIRIAVLKIDPPMAGFDSEPAMEAPAQEVCDAPESVEEEEQAGVGQLVP